MVDFEDDIKNCISTLNNRGTVLYPTDTIWGLGCDALNEDAVEKIFVIKNRPKEKSLIVLLAEPRDILYFVAAPPPDIIDIVEQFTEPTTIIYQGAIHFPDNVVNTDGTIAIRVTTDPFCKALIKRLRKPIISTSANLSGEPTAAFFSQINPAIVQQVDYVVKYKQDDHTPKKPSRIARIDDEGNLDYIR